VKLITCAGKTYLVRDTRKSLRQGKNGVQMSLWRQLSFIAKNRRGRRPVHKLGQTGERCPSSGRERHVVDAGAKGRRCERTKLRAGGRFYVSHYAFEPKVLIAKDTGKRIKVQRKEKYTREGARKGAANQKQLLNVKNLEKGVNRQKAAASMGRDRKKILAAP